jgi:large subunit ribosomal protein L18
MAVQVPLKRHSPKYKRRYRIKKGIRQKIAGTAERPRLTVYRSNTAIYAQIIDDDKGHTLASCSSRIQEINEQQVNKTEKSKMVGHKLAAKAREAGIEKVVFDRNGYLYHGRVKALADAAREGGLDF